MNIGWASARVDAQTGYGTQSRGIISHILASSNKHKIWNIGSLGAGAGTVWGGKRMYAVKVNGKTINIPILITSKDMTGENEMPMYIQKYGFDLVITFWDVFVIGWAQNLNVPSIAYFPVDGPFTFEMYKHIKDIHRAVVFSKFGYNELLNWMPPSKLRCISHGIETNVYKPQSEKLRRRMRAEMNVPKDTFLIIDSGANIGERKQLPLLMRMFKMFLKTHPDAYLGLFTSPTMMSPQGYDLNGYADMLGIKERIWFPPVDPIIEPWSDEKLAQFYSAGDVFATPTLAEGFGLPMVEAMSSGTPAVGTNCSSLTELIGDHGWLVDIDPEFTFIPVWIPTLQEYPVPKIKSFLICLDDAYANPDKRDRYGKMSRKFVEENYAWNLVTPKWNALLKEIEEELFMFREIR